MMAKRANKRQLVWVTWVDAVADSSRAHGDSISEVALAINVNLGWIEHENEKRIVLAHGYSNTGEIDHFAIPRGDIQSIEPISPPRKKKGGLDAGNE